MDHTTQQNAAMVEEASAASREMAGEAQQLHRLVGQFRLDGGPAREAPPRSATPTPSAAKLAATPRSRTAA
jgi:methyl-accepting chemotaxis protein